MCGHICPSAVGVPACYDGVCGVSTCTDPNAECDGSEHHALRNRRDRRPGQLRRLRHGVLLPERERHLRQSRLHARACNAGWADCSSTPDGCETRLGTPPACRSCGESCTNEHGEIRMRRERLRAHLPDLVRRLRQDRNNGCETQLRSLRTAAPARAPARVAHGTPSCARHLRHLHCDPGWDDCDDDPAERLRNATRDDPKLRSLRQHVLELARHERLHRLARQLRLLAHLHRRLAQLHESGRRLRNGRERHRRLSRFRQRACFVSWNAVAAATSYIVRRSTTSGGPYTDVATVTAPTYVNTGLTNGTHYYYVVAAVVPCGTGVSSAQVRAIPDGQLVAHYMFDETSGTSAVDASGNGRTATLSGATFTAGRRGNGVRIAGGTQRVNLPANIVQGCTDLTIATWVRLTTNTADWARFFDFGRDDRLPVHDPARRRTDVLRFAITDGRQRQSSGFRTPTRLPITTWKHVAVTLGGTTGRLYLDAVEVAQNAAIALNPVDSRRDGQRLARRFPIRGRPHPRRHSRRLPNFVPRLQRSRNRNYSLTHVAVGKALLGWGMRKHSLSSEGDEGER